MSFTLSQDREPAAADSVAGLVERVTFHNEENGWSVLKVRAQGHRDLVTVVGSLPAVTAGEWLEASGRWVQDREFGTQLKAETLRTAPPDSAEGIERYLASGLVRGIGPSYARKLVAAFGTGIFDVIETASARLEQVPGIGPKRRLRIKQAWNEQKAVRRIMVFLHGHGVSTSRAVRIHKTYGDEAIEVVRTDPYRLARDIPGIGFKTADQIALRVGLAPDSPRRVDAGIRHVLLEATDSGHCALPFDELRDKAADCLGAPAPLVLGGMERSLQEHALVRENMDGIDLLFLPHLREAEQGIARALLARVQAPAPFANVDALAALPSIEAETGRPLAPTQRQALLKALQHAIMVITGGPGVGKTTLLRTLIALLRRHNVRIVLAAPTGRAARRLSEATGQPASTLHRLLEFQPGGGGFARNPSQPLATDLLVIDECSMVDVPLLHAALRALPRTAALWLVGDADQLPSVGPGTVLRDLIESGGLPVARLVEVFRQDAASRIITNAHRINEGLVPDLARPAELSDFYWIEREDPERILETLVEVVRDRIPARFGLDPVRDVQVLTPQNRGSLGVRELNRVLQSVLNPPGEPDHAIQRFGTDFRPGDKVLQTRNNYDKDVFNGDIGRIRAIDAVEQEVEVDFEGRVARYEFGELDELVLAYATTVHKSQGSEFPAVVVPLASQQFLLLQRNLLYTAVTRAKRLVVLVGQARALQRAVQNHHVERRWGGLLARLRPASQ